MVFAYCTVKTGCAHAQNPNINVDTRMCPENIEHPNIDMDGRIASPPIPDKIKRPILTLTTATFLHCTR